MRLPTIPLGWLLVSAALLLVGNLAARAVEKANERPDFTGTWQLNNEESDDLREKMLEARQGRGNGSGGSRGGGGFGGPPAGRGGMGGPRGRFGGRGGGDRGDMGAPPLMREALERLVISHSDPEITISYGDGRLLVLYTDGRKIERESPFGEVLVFKTKWKEDRIVVKRRSEGRPEVTEIYELSPERERLFVTLEFEPPRGGGQITLRRVYESVDADLGPAG
jgi:hypothetical protein